MNAQEHWAIYFKYLTDKSKRDKINRIVELEVGIEMASKVLIKISKDEREFFRQFSREKYELDAQHDKYMEKLALAAERRKGKREGKREGKLEGKSEIINLLKTGKSIEEIIKDHDELK